MQVALRQLLPGFLSTAFFYAVIAVGGGVTLALVLGVSLGTTIRQRQHAGNNYRTPSEVKTAIETCLPFE
jgi:hypothetical protein